MAAVSANNAGAKHWRGNSVVMGQGSSHRTMPAHTNSADHTRQSEWSAGHRAQMHLLNSRSAELFFVVRTATYAM